MIATLWTGPICSQSWGRSRTHITLLATTPCRCSVGHYHGCKPCGWFTIADGGSGHGQRYWGPPGVLFEGPGDPRVGRSRTRCRDRLCWAEGGSLLLLSPLCVLPHNLPDRSDLRLHCSYILRRRNGLDYRTMNDVVSVRNQPQTKAMTEIGVSSKSAEEIVEEGKRRAAALPTSPANMGLKNRDR